MISLNVPELCPPRNECTWTTPLYSVKPSVCCEVRCELSCWIAVLRRRSLTLRHAKGTCESSKTRRMIPRISFFERIRNSHKKAQKSQGELRTVSIIHFVLFVPFCGYLLEANSHAQAYHAIAGRTAARPEGELI